MLASSSTFEYEGRNTRAPEGGLFSRCPPALVGRGRGPDNDTTRDATVRLKVKTKTWIENEERDLLFGKGKTEILELIDEAGSIAKAADKIGMNYRKAWSHIKMLQENIADDLVIPQKGGGGKGGTTLTPNARQLIEDYRLLQRDIEAYANRRFAELFDDIPGLSR